jgi:ABC-2 type transport system permease protein
MILRVATMRDFPLAQVIGSMALLAASVVLTIWAAGKIFRVGILMYGKRPGLREVLRWLGRE